MNKRVLVLAVIVALGSQAAWADSIGRRVERARSHHASAVVQLHGLEADLGGVRGELGTAEDLLDAATVQLVDARNRERDAGIRLALAEDVLFRRVRAAYEQGPENTLDMFFSAQSPGDLLSINEYTSHAVLSDLNAIDQVRRGKLEMSREQQALRLRQRALTGQEKQVRSLLDQLQARVAQAMSAAKQAGVRVRSLEATARQIERARAREARRVALLAQGAGSDWEAKLLALLGPEGGRGCAIPSGLRDTGHTVSGDASWYGKQFAGGPTASGATFDPSLFTAAHRTLPLGVFLRVHFGERCAIVLVNDRGPYGNFHRIIDLAHAPAEYLGLGVGHVTADVLVTRS